MSVRLLYLIMVRVFGWLVLLGRSQASKDAEVSWPGPGRTGPTRVQPDEGISLHFGAKVPGHEFRLRKASMDFAYSQGYGESRDDAYERVILDALIGDATLFIRSDEVARSWRIVDPLLAHWEQAPDPIPLSHGATWGPREAAQLIERDGREGALSDSHLLSQGGSASRIVRLY